MAVLVGSHAPGVFPAALRALIACGAALLGPAAAAAGADADAADVDGDQVPDASDLCPRRPGVAPDGCPPRDTDGDGVVDRGDPCPDRPGPIANRGCPDTDRDADGVVDRLDRCPDVYGRRAHAGCEPPDRDQDGVPDDDDRCPDGPETWNGRRDRDGCPDRGAPLARARGKRLELLGRRLFRDGGALATEGKRAADVAAAWLAARGARGAVVSVRESDRRRRGDGAERARARARALAARLAARSGLAPAVLPIALLPRDDPAAVILEVP